MVGRCTSAREIAHGPCYVCYVLHILYGLIRQIVAAAFASSIGGVVLVVPFSKIYEIK